MTPPRVLLDACVLYPSVLREIVTGVAAQGALVPVWSPRILAEWQHAVARLGPVEALHAQGEAARLRAAFPQAEVMPDPVTEAALDLPDAADAHVLAAAIAGSASVLCTLNLRDFPARALAHHGCRALSPDDLLMDLWLADRTSVEAAVSQVRAETERLSDRPQPLRALLKRASLPRLGKALAE